MKSLVKTVRRTARKRRRRTQSQWEWCKLRAVCPRPTRCTTSGPRTRTMHSFRTSSMTSLSSAMHSNRYLINSTSFILIAGFSFGPVFGKPRFLFCRNLEFFPWVIEFFSWVIEIFSWVIDIFSWIFWKAADFPLKIDYFCSIPV